MSTDDAQPQDMADDDMACPPDALSQNDFVTPKRQPGRPRKTANDAERQRAKRARDRRLAQLSAAVLFPYYGGKYDIAELVWECLGPVKHYAEPFAGSASVYLACPYRLRLATLNDAYGHITNTWRALKFAPLEVAWWADRPANEIDLLPISLRLQASLPALVERLWADDRYYEAELAGLWIWWMSSRMPTRLERESHQLQTSTTGHGIHAGNKRARLPQICQVIGARLHNARILCRDWQKVLTETDLHAAGKPVGIFLDPPYDRTRRDKGLYAQDSDDVAQAVRAWAVQHGEDRRLRIALCGFEDEHAMPQGWTPHPWTTRGGMSNTAAHGRGNGENRREVVWFSPHCLPATQLALLQEKT